MARPLGKTIDRHRPGEQEFRSAGHGELTHGIPQWPSVSGFTHEKRGHMKKTFLSLAVALAVLVGTPSLGIAGELAARLWSVAVHFEYADGTEYDYVLASGLSTSAMKAMLSECGRSHWDGSVVRYHCFPIPE
jgi:hypothetical protein